METIKVGDTVYQTKKGWSGVPMEVLDIDNDHVLCKGIGGWSVNGLYSREYNATVSRYHITRLSHIYNNALVL